MRNVFGIQTVAFSSNVGFCGPRSGQTRETKAITIFVRPGSMVGPEDPHQHQTPSLKHSVFCIGHNKNGQNILCFQRFSDERERTHHPSKETQRDLPQRDSEMRFKSKVTQRNLHLTFSERPSPKRSSRETPCKKLLCQERASSRDPQRDLPKRNPQRRL